MISVRKMAATTPEKSVNIDCFICFERGVICFKLNGQKCTGANFHEHLQRITGDTLYLDLMKRDATICRNWFSRVISVSEFIKKKCHHSTQSYLRSSLCKRGALSQLTPRSASNILLPTLPVCKTRKNVETWLLYRHD